MSYTRVCQIILVVLMIAALTVNPAQAADQPQVGSTDEDGDLVLGEVPPLEVEEMTAWPNVIQYFLEDAPAADIVDPYPFAPSSENVKNRTPRFKFTRVEGAKRYKVQVFDVNADEVYYTYKGVCMPDISPADECWMQPLIELKTKKLGNVGGDYKWRVRARVGDEWLPFSDYAYFTVISKGFNSTFDVDAQKWSTIAGKWWIVQPGYLKTKGVTDVTASIIQKEYFIDGMVYEARMRRKVEDSPNRLYFHGYPFPNEAAGWDDGYYFQYRNDGTWSLIKTENGTPSVIIGWTFSEFIKPYDWNKLTVFTDTPNLYFFINGEYVGKAIAEITFTSGWVGIGMRESDAEKSPLLVDWARLYYSELPPYTIP